MLDADSVFWILNSGLRDLEAASSPSVGFIVSPLAGQDEY